MNQRKKFLKIIIILVLLTITVIFIWMNSVQSRPESKAQSERVLVIVEPFLELFVGEGNVTNRLVRKLAHFIEYFIFGCIIAIFTISIKRTDVKYVVASFVAALAVAVIDETIQVFTNRGASFKDVMLDFAGASAAILLVRIIYLLTHAKK